MEAVLDDLADELDKVTDSVTGEQLDRLRHKARHTRDVLKSHVRSSRTALQFVSELCTELDRIAEGGIATDGDLDDPARG